MRMIDRLTPAQEARFPEFIEKWTRIGLSTEPANREKAEQAIRALYRLAKLDDPKIFWLPCPISGVSAAMEFAARSNTSAVRSAVESAVESAVGSAVESAGLSYYAGSLWPGYAAWADFFHEGCGVAIDRNYLDFIESCGYAWFLKGVCFATERALEINRDDAGRLHSETGMSIRYRSGWGLWHFHGVQVDEQVTLKPATQTIEQISGEQNAEVKRARLERYGWEKYLRKTNATVLDRRRNDVEGTREALMESRDGLKVLVCHCPSTGRVYAMEVDPAVASCEGAQRFLWSGSSVASRMKRLNVIGRS